MATSTNDGHDQHTVDAIMRILKPKHIRDGHDSLFLVLHSFMISAGFRLVGLGDDGSFVGESKQLPEHWRGEIVSQHSQSGSSTNSGGDIRSTIASTANSGTSSGLQQTGTPKTATVDNWAFRYRHSKSSMTFVLKALRLGSRLSVHAYIVEQDDVVVSLDLQVSQYVDVASEAFKSLISNGEYSENQSWMAFLKNLEDLHAKYKKEVMVKLMPEVEDLASQMRFEARANAPSNAMRDPLRVDRGDRAPPRFAPRLPNYDDDYGVDPGFLPANQPDFAYYGDDDLFGSMPSYGQVPGGFNPRNPLGGPRMGGRGGLGVGPHHPGFGPQVNDPYAMPGSGGGRGAGYYQPPPPGARFDPFGPPIHPGAAPPSNPNPPGAPPGFENWYS